MKLFNKFGSHYAIERFGVIFLSLSLCMALLLCSIGYRKFTIDKSRMADQSIYTTAFRFSKTQSEGSVRGVYINGDRTKCMLLLRMSSMSSIPIDANEYLMLLTGSDKYQYTHELKSNPTAKMYLFGSTGYMGIYLENETPFPSQIMSLTLRSTNNFAGGQGSEMYDDKSFVNYNQARIYFNPGGGNAKHVKFLDSDNWDAKDAYEEMISKPREKNLRTVLRDTLISMRKQQTIISEYTDRLKKQGLAEPTVPKEIAGDIISAIDPNDETRTHLKWSSEEERWLNQDGSTVYTDDAAWLFLDSEYIIPGGYNYNWQDGSIKTGYLKGLTGSDNVNDWNKYLSDHAKEIKPRELDINVEWKYADGTLFTQDGESDRSDSRVIHDSISALTNAWVEYYNIKTEYQTKHLAELLQLEIDSVSVGSNYTVNENKDGKSLILY